MKYWLLLVSVVLLAQVKVHACYYDFTDACGGANSQFMLVKCISPDAPPPEKPKVFCADPTWSQNDLEINICGGSYSANIELFRQCPYGEPPKAQSSVWPNYTKNSCGSVIVTDTQSLVEKINLTGIPYPIVYSSQKVKGRKDWFYKKIPITGTSYGSPTDVAYQSLRVEIAGQIHSIQISPVTSGMSYDFVWDGKDNNSNLVEGTWEAKIAVSEFYDQSFNITNGDIVYCTASGCEFPSKLKNNLTSLTMEAPLSSKVFLGTIFDENYGFGGWEFSIHHSYDPVRKVLYFGDGSTLNSAYKIQPNGDMWVVSRERSEVYIFDSQKRHVSTISSTTGKTKYSFTYGTNGLLSSITDSYNNIVSLQYSGRNLVSITSPYGQVTNITTDANGYLATVTNPSSDTYEISYSSDGLMLTFEKPSGTVSTMTYDTMGLLLTDSSSAGSSTTLARNNQGQLTETTELLRLINHNYNITATEFSRAVINPNGFEQNYVENLITGTLSYSDSTSFSVNTSTQNDLRFGEEFKRMSALNVNDASNYMQTTFAETFSLSDEDDPFSYNALTMSTTSNGNSYQTVYNPSANTVVMSSPLGRTRTDTLNAKDDVVSTQFASFTPVNYTYDNRGRVEEVAQGTSRITTISYNPSNGEVASIQNALLQTMNFTYNTAGRVLTQTLPDSRVIAYTYDANGNLTSVTPPGRPVHELQYNGFDYLSSYIPPTLALPSTTATSYSYSDDRELTLITRPDGQTIQRNFDITTGDLASETLPNGTRNYTYHNGILRNAVSEDNFTRFMSRSGSKIAYELIYDAALSFNITYTFDAILRPADETLTRGVSSVTVPFYYDDDGLLVIAGDETLTRSTTTGFVTSTKLNNSWQHFDYSSDFGELVSITSKYNNTTNTYQELLTRDNLGRISSKTEQYGTASAKVFIYSYDSSGRLTDVSLNGSPQSSYSYDSNSNRTSQTIGGVTIAATYDDQDRLLTFGNKTFTYNINGEVASVTTSAGVTSFIYDVMGNLKSVILPHKTVNYQVDAFNRRMTKLNGTTLENYFVWNSSNQLIGMTDGSGFLTARFVYGSKSHVPDYVIKGSVKYHLVTDHLGSPVQVIDSTTGLIAQEITYDEFGNILSDTNPGFTPFGFAGCLYDQDTKLCRFGARDYDASIGRWLSKDPILFAGGDTNLYGYVFNDPVNLIDPSGKFGIPGAISGFVSGVLGGYATGGMNGAIVGGVVGAAVGAINPFGASAAGSFAGGVVSSLLGQVTGNAMEGNNLLSIDPTLALASGFGGATGTMFGNALKIGNPYIQGVLGGAGEALFGIPTQMMSPGPMDFGKCGGK